MDQETIKKDIPVESPEQDEANALLHELTPRLSAEEEQQLATLIQTDYNLSLIHI